MIIFCTPSSIILSACRAECDTGMRRCLGTAIGSCCNFYLNDTCVVECPPLLEGDPERFYCGKSMIL